MRKVALQNIMMRAGVFFLGVMVAVLILEAGLRTHRVFLESRIAPKTAENKKTILCIGDSFVWGHGADSAHSYPRQLEKLLGEKFRVINAGVSGQNTSQLLNSFESLIDSYNPEMVIILTGSANFWNYEGFDAYLRDNGSLNFLRGYVYRSSIYKLMKLFYSDWRNRLIPQESEEGLHRGLTKMVNEDNANAGWDYLMQGNIQMALSCFEKDTREADCSPRSYCGIAWIYKGEKKYAEALEYYQKAVESNPSYVDAYAYAGECCEYQGKNKEAIEWYKRGILAKPEAEENFNYGKIVKAVIDSNEKDSQNDVLLFLKDIALTLPKRNRLICSSIKIMEENIKRSSESAVERWIEKDIMKIVKMSSGKNSAVILMNYPGEFKQLNGLLRNVAQQLSVPFVDIHNSFSLLAKHGDMTAYFVPDGHCNARGYGVIAEEIYKKMLQIGAASR